MSTAIPGDDIDALSYEAALTELDTLITKLEGGSVALEDAISAYERGSRLARHCASLLDRTEQRVQQLVVGGDGGLAERPLDVTAHPAATPESVPAGLFAEPPARPRRPRVDPDDVPF